MTSVEGRKENPSIEEFRYRDLLEAHKKIKELKEALRFYADSSSWYVNGCIKLHNHIDDSDLQKLDSKGTLIGGLRARKALERG